VRDPGLRFWLNHVEASGGLWEPAGDRALVMLPDGLADLYRLPTEVFVTDDPDVAREDGATFLGTGHPVLMEAATSALTAGDVGTGVLERPTTPAPTSDVLEDRARAQLPVSHGRIDAVEPARPVIHWVLRLGTLATYTVSSEDHFQEEIERWVHVDSRREVPATILDRLIRTPLAESSVDPVPVGELAHALDEADRIIEAAAIRRRADLARQNQGHDAERQRAMTYYADAIAGIQRRLGTATPNRQALLEARLASTREEQARRLAEITEKYEARHEIRPFRLQAIGVPALRLPVDVRRGERRYPMELDWLLPAGVFALPRCPSCRSSASLVAGKNALGCMSCQTRAVSTAPAPRQKPTTGRPVSPAPVAEKPVAEPVSPVKPSGVAHSVPPPSARPRQPAHPPTHIGRTKGRSSTDAPPRRADNIATTLWTAIADGRTRGVRHVLAPDSPAAVLHRLYGLRGLRCAIGMPDNAEPDGFSTGSARLPEGGGITRGTVTTNTGTYDYVLRWHELAGGPSVVEVLPYAPFPGDRFSMYYWFFRPPSQPDIVASDLARSILDDVAVRIVDIGVPWHGLPFGGRALAAWLRLADQHDEVLGMHPPDALAAALHRLVAHRAGDRGLYRDAAEAYRADETAVRGADAQLRRRLALGSNRAW